MPRRGSIISIVLLLLALALGLASCSSTGPGSAVPQGINEGTRARDFTLKAMDGSKASLSDYRGGPVLINFWATWCAPCRAEIPDFEAAYQAHKDEGFVVLGVNVEESQQAVESFVAEVGMTYPVLLDEHGQVMREYRSQGLPMSLLLDEEGVIQVRHVGLLSGDKLEEYLGKVLP
jgi:peroxiredoxin